MGTLSHEAAHAIAATLPAACQSSQQRFPATAKAAAASDMSKATGNQCVPMLWIATSAHAYVASIMKLP